MPGRDFRQGARAFVRGVPGLDPRRRHRSRLGHRRRTGPRPWRRDPPRRGHDRRNPAADHSRSCRGACPPIAAPAPTVDEPRDVGLPMNVEAYSCGVALLDALSAQRFFSLDTRRPVKLQLDRAPDYRSGGREFQISPGAPLRYRTGRTPSLLPILRSMRRPACARARSWRP